MLKFKRIRLESMLLSLTHTHTHNQEDRTLLCFQPVFQLEPRKKSNEMPSEKNREFNRMELVALISKLQQTKTSERARGRERKYTHRKWRHILSPRQVYDFDETIWSSYESCVSLFILTCFRTNKHTNEKEIIIVWTRVCEPSYLSVSHAWGGYSSFRKK